MLVQEEPRKKFGRIAREVRISTLTTASGLADSSSATQSVLLASLHVDLFWKNLYQLQLNCTLLNNNKSIIHVKCTHLQGKAKYLCARSHHHWESGPPKQSTGESRWLIFLPWQKNLCSTGPCFPAIPRVLLATGQAGAQPDMGEKNCREGVGLFMPFSPDLYSKLLPKVTKLKEPLIKALLP